MKKIKIFALMLLAGATLFTNCKKDETFADPTVSFQGGVTSMVFTGTNSIDINVTFAAEGKIESVTLQGPSLTSSGTTTTTITSKMGTSGTDNANGETSATYLFKVTATDLALAFVNHTTLTYTFTITDQESSSTTGTFTVTTPSATPISTYTGISLTSAYSGPTANEFVAATTGTASNHTAAGSATFGFVSGGATNGATIFTKGFDFTLSSVPNPWNNQSYVATTTLTASQFDAITDETALLAALPGSITGTKVNLLQDGATNAGVEVIAFVDGSGKKGLVKLPASMDNTAAQVISVSIKVQQ